MSTLAINWPQPFQSFQRDGANSSDIAIEAAVGSYSGADGGLEASWCGGTYKTVVASPANGTNVGTLTGQVCVPFTPSLCQGTLTVRFINNHAVSATVSTVGIGDGFCDVGDSRPAGTGTNGQVYVNGPGLKATRWSFNTGTWQDVNSPAEGGGAGSIFPLIATLHMLDQGVPCFYLNEGHTGTDVIGDTSWDKDGLAIAFNDTVTAAGNSRVNGYKAILCYLGPNASTVGGYTVAQVKTALTALRNNLRSQIAAAASAVMYVDSHGPCSVAVNRASLDNYRNAVKQLADAGTIYAGPVEEDMNYDVHWITDATILTVARRSWLAIKHHSFGGTNKRGPRPVSLTIDSGRTVLTLGLDQILSNAAGAAMTAAAFRTYDGATPSTPSSVLVTSDQMGLTITAAAPIVGTPTIDFASGDDAKNATVPLSVAWALSDGNTATLPMEPIYGQGLQAASTGRFANIFAGAVRN